ncbi:TPA: hypothetical protein ACPVZG_000683 [Vibrio parahaemolyticus]|nr:hypothetical protein [Vibrio parahaemolyticus]
MTSHISSENYEKAIASFKKYKLRYSELANNQVTVTRKGVTVDFWPNTGTWRTRTGGKSKGLSALLSFLFKPEDFQFETKAPTTNNQLKSDKISAAKALLDEKEIPYRTMTAYQLRIGFNGGFVDLWPSSNKWSVNGTKSKQGLDDLFAFLENKKLGF